MSRVRWNAVAGLVILAVLAAPSVYAGLELLPASSHYQGARVDGNLRIEFAVYDTQGGDEFAAAGFEVPAEGRFTYVYQLFNEGGSSDIEYFEVSGLGLGAVSGNEQIGSADDLQAGIATTDAYFNVSLTKGAWEFEDATLIVGEHSVFLVISSDNDWVVGQYSLQRADDLPVPGGDNEVPEPVTLLLTAVGGLGLLGVKRAR